MLVGDDANCPPIRVLEVLFIFIHLVHPHVGEKRVPVLSILCCKVRFVPRQLIGHFLDKGDMLLGQFQISVISPVVVGDDLTRG